MTDQATTENCSDRAHGHQGSRKFLEGMATPDQNSCALLADPFIAEFAMGDLEEVARTVRHRVGELCDYNFA